MQNNNTVLITGGAKGIGKATAEMFAKNNYNVVVAYNHSFEQAKALELDLKSKGLEISIIKCDVSLKKDCDELISFCLKTYGKIDVLINNAGIAEHCLLIDKTYEQITEMLNTNLQSAIYLSKLALTDMLKRKSGNIINISSVLGITGASCETTYSVSKAGLICLTKSLSKEYSSFGIRINCVAPGCVNTDMMKTYSENDIQDIIKEIPLGRFAQPEEISACIKFFIDNNYITGQTLSIDGGFLI